MADIAEKAVRSVVNISTSQAVPTDPHSPYESNPWYHFFGRPPGERRARSLGSGVIVASPGVVLTNNHVVKNAREIRVTLHDGTELGADLIGSDAKSDLAVLRVKDAGSVKLVPMALGKSAQLRLGEVVLAIGNPFGVGQTVTMGIVSAKGRGNMGIVDYEDFIQTDAAINPGNSGGALVDLRGQLVGINTAILSRSGGYQGIGFAIPSDMARPIMESLLKHGRVVRGYLGVELQDLDRNLARAMGLPDGKGVLVSQVQPSSPAETAGLRRGDILTQLEGENLDNSQKLRNRIAALAPGTRVKLTLRREQQLLDLEVVLGTLGGSPVATIERGQGSLSGLTVETLEDEHRRRLGLDAEVQGVLVTRVEWGSSAEEAGLKEGDLIVEVARRPVATAEQFMTLYKAASDKVLLLVVRQGSAMYLLLDR